MSFDVDQANASTYKMSGIVALFIALLAHGCMPLERSFEVEAGLVGFVEQNGHPRATLIEKTDKIHRKMERLTGIGFSISSSSEEPYVVRTVHFLPGNPGEISEGTFEEYEPDDLISGLKTKPIKVTGGRYFYWHLDETDPLGRYIIEVYVDGQLVETLTFTVVE